MHQPTARTIALVCSLLAAACGDDASASALDAGLGCPEGLQAPLGFGCGDEGLRCRYGDDPPQCGGRTVICHNRRWEELDHTDPQPSCSDAGPDSSVDAQGPSIDASDVQHGDAGDGAADASALCQAVASDGGCSYVRSEGTATIRAVEAPPQGAYSCKNGGVTVRFTFVADDPAREACFRTDDEQENTFTFRVGGGANPPRSCIEGAGARVGTELRVTRQDIVGGTCTPVVFTFPESLRSACMSACMF